MTIISDYHVHTYLCKHAVGEPIEYLEIAKQRGLKTVGFADHCPVPDGFDVESRMDVAQFDKYLDVINSLKGNSFGIEVLLGMEVDWVPDRMDEVFEFLSGVEYDYLIGSVHHTEELPFDHPKYMHLWDSEEKVQSIWNIYIDKMIQMVASKKFDIIGHLDLPKKFGIYPQDRTYFIEEIKDLLSLAADLNVAIELNTAGLRKPVKEIYPSLELLKFAKERNVKITFGSDAHTPKEVGYNFSAAAELAKQAGYKEYLIIEKNGRKKTLEL